MSQTDYIGPGPTVTIHEAAGSLPAPTGYDGGALLAPIQTGRAIPGTGQVVRANPTSAILRIDAVGAEAVLAGPVELFAGNETEQSYHTAATLEGGAAITVSAQNGYPVRVFLGGDWERVRLVSAGVSNPVTVTLTAEVTE